MDTRDLQSWIQDHSSEDVVWYVKRLSANDTSAGGSNQAGPYFPRDFLLEVFPKLNQQSIVNPNVNFSLTIDSVDESESSKIQVRAVWYNSRWDSQ